MSSRLGRGLDALLQGRGLEQLSQLSPIETVAVGAIVPNPDQPRKRFSDASLAELAESIRQQGIIQPILVQPHQAGGFRIVAGERRYRAALLAGLTEVPVLCREYSDAEVMEIALVENIQREDLNPVEEARAFRHIVDTYSVSQDELAKRLGKSRSAVANSLRLLRLPLSVLEILESGELSAGHARAILAVDTEDTGRLEAFAHAIVARSLTVRDAETWAKALNEGRTPWESPAIAPAVADIAPPGESVLPSANGVDSGDVGDSASPKSPKLAQADLFPVRDPNLWSIEETLIKSLGTKVAIKGDIFSGKIEISYFSKDDLNRICDLLISPEASSRV